MKDKKKKDSTCFLMRLWMIFICCIYSSGSFANTLHTLDSLLTELDHTIRQEAIYTARKVNYMDNLRFKLSATTLHPEDQYLLYQQLAREYEIFRCDTAIQYATRRLALAEETGNRQWVQDSKFQLASVLAKACMFEKAITLLETIDKSLLTSQQMASYYKAYRDTYIFYTEFYQEGYEISEISRLRSAYQDSLLTVVSPHTFEYVLPYGTYYIETGAFEKAEELLLSYYERLQPDTKDFALLTSILAYLYEKKEVPLLRKIYLARSAIADIKAANKENISLRFLAHLLFLDGDVKRANVYIKKSMDDANFFNGRLRNTQTSMMLPIIDEAYQAERLQQQKKLMLLLGVVSILLVILIITLIFVKRQMNKLSRAQKEILQINERLNELNRDLQEANQLHKEMNKSLTEANYIKEQLIGTFLDICTEYIDKFQKFKIFVNRKIKVGQLNDIIKITGKTESGTQELKDLYASFDKAFLAIYPDFVEEFNKLLREEERYPVKEDQSLNQELRVFALVRLGITDSNKIATFLHYTLRTIYNYRHKVKAKAIHPDEDFEERIRQICLPDMNDN